MLGNTILCYIYFFIYIICGIIWLNSDEREFGIPYEKGYKMRCSGPESLFIFLMWTGPIALIPVLSLKLFAVMVFAVLCIAKSPETVKLTPPLTVMIIFLIWAGIGMFYSPDAEYGFRMLLKYLAPLLMALAAMVVVRQWEVVMVALYWFRWIVFIAVLLLLTGMLRFITGGIFWNSAAVCTSLLTAMMFSLILWKSGIHPKQNQFFFWLFLACPFIFVYRTNLMGLSVALATFAFVKYRVKALPVIVLLAFLAFASLFYIPTFKEKMFYNGGEGITMMQFLEGDYDRNQFNTNARDMLKEHVEENVEITNRFIGAGTGAVQHYFYELEKESGLRGGQVHNDLFILVTDNGWLGISLYIFAYVLAILQCVSIYRNSDTAAVKNTALMAASVLGGMLFTLYSDNTVSYSMTTLCYPWALYGMAVALRRQEEENESVYVYHSLNYE